MKKNRYEKKQWNTIRNEYTSAHVAVWENFMETHAPSGFVIHHLDQNPLNNDIHNLVCTTRSEHTRWHSTHRTIETLNKMSEAKKNRKRKLFSEETRRKISKAAKNRKPISEETRRKMSESAKNRRREK